MNKAELLWLYYDYHTETFDQALPHVPDRYDKGAVMVRGPWQVLSNRYAGNLRRRVFDMAKFFQIPEEVWEYERKARMQFNTQYQLDKYNWVMEHTPEAYDFLNAYYKFEQEIAEHNYNHIQQHLKELDNRIFGGLGVSKKLLEGDKADESE